MRIIAIIVAGAIGWLWFEARESVEPPKPITSRARRADLSSLETQLAIASVSEPPRSAAIAPTLELTVDEQLLENIEPSEEEEVPAWEPEPADAIDLSGADEYNEIIQIVDSAPIVDTTTVTRCGVIVDDYTVNIPVARVFEPELVEPEIIDSDIIEDVPRTSDE